MSDPAYVPSSIARARNIADLRRMARRRLPRMVFDYIDGGADDEVSLARSVSRFRDLELTWDALADVSEVDTSTTIMGAASASPFFISPTATSRLFHPRQGELAVARAAHAAGVPYACSTLASSSVEDIAAANPGTKWFQVYVWRDRALVKEMLARAKAAGFSAILLTVDVPVAGNRERDGANDFTIPPKVTWRTATQALAAPGYLWDLMTTPEIRPANFAHIRIDGGLIGFINAQFDRTVTWKDAQWLRDNWDGNLAIKGISTPEDAQRCIGIGANAVWVSNHGGRQLDTAPATIDMLPGIAEAVADKAEIILDGGVRRGSDVVKALALGANAVAVGRAYLYGLGAGGERGVRRALEILDSELRRTMALCGRARLSGLTRDLIFKKTLP
ncbi:alpha-hydroxy acid oxidase [Candidatus Viadribacter manganicus]|uniref:2-hydroxy-acid oxidase n=1 Tax=Candidatus Viadribacter manganicus TaxID=1759059 RepID=A0A1B1AHX3_9PROT|nr:alpha-hydroxy acid oxidase [Candidatus Viadribacter manganicus]ANP46159.1 2-hydroxy-acid oxidase [Candidatus Viadribacter manganicus]